MHQCVEDGQPWDIEVQLITAKGRMIWIRSLGEAELNDGVTVRLIGAIQNVTDRRLLEARIVESEKFFRQLADSLPLRISYLDRARRYRFVNQTALRSFGCTLEQVIGRTRAEIMPQSDDTLFAERARLVLGGMEQCFEFDYVVDGQECRFENRLVAHRDALGTVQGFFVSGTDITERARAEKAQRHLTAIFDATTDYVVQTNKQGQLQYLNPAARRLTGIAIHQSVAHLTIADFTPLLSLEKHREEIVPTALEKGVWVGESVILDAQHNEIPVSHMVIAHRDQKGKFEYFSGLLRNISAEKVARNALRESEHRFRVITDHLPVLISYLDRDFRFRFVNKTYRDWFGVDADQQLGMHLREFYGEQAWQSIEQHMTVALMGQEVTYERDVEVAGVLRHIHVTAIPDRTEQGDIKGLFTLVTDVSAFRTAERALKESEERLRTVADALPVRVAYIDKELRYRFNNLAYVSAFGRPREEFFGRTVLESVGESAFRLIEPNMLRALRGETVTHQSELVRAKGVEYYEAQYLPHFAADGVTVLGFHAVIVDITRQKLEEMRLTEVAQKDALTGVTNRRGFEQCLIKAMDQCRRKGDFMALMYLDIDYFKTINDKLGHQIGDSLLHAFACRLVQSMRSTDTVSRLGGDEFTVIVAGFDNPKIATILANKIVEAIRLPFILDGIQVIVTTSVGLAFYHGEATTPKELVGLADEMLYEAKGAGRDTIKAQKIAY